MKKTNSKKIEKPSTNKYPMVVGLGASAGGLQALKTFFDALPDKPGMAFVIIIHLSPDHESSLPEILQDHTNLPVTQVNKRTKVKVDNVYVIPPGKLISLEENHLVLTKTDEQHKKLTTIDQFFRTLGKTRGSNCGCVILSGSGSDGSIGLKTVKEYGGVVIVQKPEEAEYSDMPRNALDTQLVDLTLSIDQIPQKLIDYKDSLEHIKLAPEVDALPQSDTDALYEIFSQVNLKTGHNFVNYKRKSVLRRIERRMRVIQVHSLPQYVNYIKDTPEELEELFRDLLISVTHFFRDQEAFDTLKETVIPQLFEDKKPDEWIRVWVPGCATGEEAYSIAILLMEYARAHNKSPRIKIFVSDIDVEALKIARDGRYPESIDTDISSEYLSKYFKLDDFGYQVKPEVMDLILFAKHDLLKDPPFSKLDLISCRNLLIYLDRELQAKVFNLFQYALDAGKWLFLGMSDSILEASEAFDSVNKKYKIYRQKPMSESFFKRPPFPLLGSQKGEHLNPKRKWSKQESINIEALHEDLLIAEFAPPSVIINKNYDVIHSTNDIDKYLKYSGGKPSNNILDMVVPEIRQVLRRLLFKVEKNDQPNSFTNQTKFESNGEARLLKIKVQPVSNSNITEDLIHVIFLEQPVNEQSNTTSIPLADSVSETDADIITALEDELEHTQEELNITVEEYETSNEELRASNEELQSMNEELQSTTEQLETSQEELQSVNEELKSVNRELEDKIDALNQSKSHLQNLMEATDIATLFVDKHKNVVFFTKRSTDLLNLIPSDKGRPFTDITHHLQYQAIVSDIDTVLSDLESVQKVVQDEEGKQYIMRIRPYKTLKDEIDGVVITFVDVTQLKAAEREIAKRANQQEGLSNLGLFALQEYDVLKIINRSCEKFHEIMDLDYCLVLEKEDERGDYRIYYSNIPELEKKQVDISSDQQHDIDLVLRSADPLITTNYNLEDRYTLLPELQQYGIISGLLINIGGPKDNYGVLCLYSKNEREFSEEYVHFGQIVSHIIGTSIERYLSLKERNKINKKLKHEIKRSKKFQQDLLNTNILQRWEVGAYLHDNLAQVLVSLKLLVDEVKVKLPDNYDEEIDEDLVLIQNHIDEQISEVRELSHDILPIDVEEEGASYAFNVLKKHTEKIHGLKLTIESDDYLDEIQNRDVSTNLYLIAQEAIKNAVNHGQASHIKITIKVDHEKGELILRIDDNGVGLDSECEDNEGMGMNIMRHRVELLHGTFDVISLPDDAEFTTCVCCTFPLDEINVIPVD